MKEITLSTLQAHHWTAEAVIEHIENKIKSLNNAGQRNGFVLRLY